MLLHTRYCGVEFGGECSKGIPNLRLVTFV